jgi:hypothetical protein
MKVRMICLTLFIVIVLFAGNATGNVNSTDQNQKTITVENVIIGTDGKMTVYDDAGNVIAYYERFKNENGDFKGVKVFDKSNKLQYTMVPNITKDKLNIYISGNENKISVLSLDKRSNAWGSKYKDDMVLFGKTFNSNIQVSYEDNGIKVNNILSFDKEPVILQKASFSYDGSEKNIFTVRTDYLEKNEADTALWALSLMLLNEINLEQSKKDNMVDNSGSSPHSTYDSENNTMSNTFNPQFR